MPKAKPTQVIVHRIELQEKERDALEAVVGAKVAKDVGQTVAIGAGVGVGAYLAYKALKEAYNWGEDVVDEIKRTPAYGFAQIAAAQPQGKAIIGFGKLVKWAFSPVEQ